MARFGIQHHPDITKKVKPPEWSGHYVFRSGCHPLLLDTLSLVGFGRLTPQP